MTEPESRPAPTNRGGEALLFPYNSQNRIPVRQLGIKRGHSLQRVLYSLEEADRLHLEVPESAQEAGNPEDDIFKFVDETYTEEEIDLLREIAGWGPPPSSQPSSGGTLYEQRLASARSDEETRLLKAANGHFYQIMASDVVFELRSGQTLREIGATDRRLWESFFHAYGHNPTGRRRLLEESIERFGEADLTEPEVKYYDFARDDEELIATIAAAGYPEDRVREVFEGVKADQHWAKRAEETTQILEAQAQQKPLTGLVIKIARNLILRSARSN